VLDERYAPRPPSCRENALELWPPPRLGRDLTIRGHCLRRLQVCSERSAGALLQLTQDAGSTSQLCLLYPCSFSSGSTIWCAIVFARTAPAVRGGGDAAPAFLALYIVNGRCVPHVTLRVCRTGAIGLRLRCRPVRDMNAIS